MIQKYIPQRIATVAQHSKPYLKAAVALVAFIVLYIFPQIVSNTFDGLSLSAYLAGYESVSTALETAAGVAETVEPVWQFAVIAVFAYYVARVHELVRGRWRDLRAVFLATLAVFIVPGLWAVFQSAIGGDYATLSAPDGQDPSVGAAVVNDFTSFSSGLFIFLAVAVLVYFYLAFNPDSLADYRDVLLSTIGVVVFIDLYHNFFDALEERLLWNNEYASPVDGLLAETFSDPFTLAVLVIYYGGIMIAFLWLVEYLGAGVGTRNSSESAA